MDQITPITPVAATVPAPLFPSVGTVLSEAWEVYKTKFKVFMKLYLWTALYSLYVIVPIVLLYVGNRVIENAMGKNTTSTAVSVVLGILAIPAIIYAIYLGVRLQVSQLITVKHRSEALTAKELLKQSGPFVGKYLWTSFLTGLLILLGFIALVVPGILLILSSCLASYIVVDMNLNGMEAIKKSWKYTKGNYWVIMKFIFVTVLISVVAQYIPELFLGKDVGSAVAGITSIIISPLLITFGYLLYEKFKLLKPELSNTPLTN